MTFIINVFCAFVKEKLNFYALFTSVSPAKAVINVALLHFSFKIPENFIYIIWRAES